MFGVVCVVLSCGSEADQRRFVMHRMDEIVEQIKSRSYDQMFRELDYGLRIQFTDRQWKENMKRLDKRYGRLVQAEISDVVFTYKEATPKIEVFWIQERKRARTYIYCQLAQREGQYRIQLWDEDKDGDWLRVKRKAIDVATDFYDGQIGHYFEQHIDQLSENITKKIRVEEYIQFLQRKTELYGPLVNAVLTDVDMEILTEGYQISCLFTVDHQDVQLYETLELIYHSDTLWIDNYQYFSDPNRSLILDMNGLEAQQISNYFFSAIISRDTMSLDLLLDRETNAHAELWFEFLDAKEQFTGQVIERTLIDAREKDLSEVPKFILDYKVNCEDIEIFERLTLIKRDGHFQVFDYVYDTHQKGLDD